MKRPVDSVAHVFDFARATVLHYATELAVCAETDAYPKTDFMNVQLRGRADTGLFAEALRRALVSYPVASSRLVDRRAGLSRRLYWVRDLPLNELVVRDLRDRCHGVSDRGRAILDFHADRVATRMDLASDYPMRFYLLQVADDVFVFSVVFHHVSLDAAWLYSLIGDVLGRYDEAVGGCGFDRREARGIGSDHASVETRTVRPLRAFVFDQVKDHFRNPQPSISLIRTAGHFDQKGRWMNHAIIDDKSLLDGMIARARRNEATLSDLFCASISRTISAWDRERGAKPDRIRGFLAVNVRHKIPAMKNASMALAGLNITTRAPADRDLDDVIAQVRTQRTSQLARGFDVAFHKFAEIVGRALRFFPKRIRDALVRNGLRSRYTFMLSNVGVLWPVVENGRPTGDSALISAGGLEIEDFYSCPSMTPDVGMVIVVLTHARRLFVSYACDRCRHNEQEARELAERLTDDLKRAAGITSEPPA